jgi:small subunit ribosomal protein S20
VVCDPQVIKPQPWRNPAILGARRALVALRGCPHAVWRDLPAAGTVTSQTAIQTIRELEASFVANIKSQIKRIRTNEKARLRNKSVKSAVKTAVRRFRDAADSGDREATLVALQSASQQLDKAASKGVIHANQAANKKSAMARRVNDL